MLGKIVVFSGIDGSGKTTVAKLLVQKLKESGIRANYHHELDFLFLKKLFYMATLFTGRDANNTLKVHVLSGVERNRPLTSEIYHLLFWLDRLVTHVLFRLRRSVTILDRCQYDFLAQFEYRDYKNRVIKKLFTLLPRQDIIILFFVDPKIAFMRKRDQNDPEIRPLLYHTWTGEKMKQLATKFAYAGEVNTEAPVEVVINYVVRTMCKKGIISDKTEVPLG